MIGNKIEYDTMSENEEGLWWYEILHGLCIDSIKNSHHEMNVQILDAGCGTGGLMQKLKQEGFKNIEGFDASNFAVNHAKSRGFDVKQGKVQDLKQLVSKENYDVIICNDVLYFLSVQDQKKFINQAYDLLNENGVLLMNLPALKAFRGNHDIAVGIKERFTRSRILNLITESRFKTSKQRYWPFLLSPIIYLTRFKQRFTSKYNKQDVVKSDINMPSPFVNGFLKMITRTEIMLLRNPKMGSSMFLELKKSRG